MVYKSVAVVALVLLTLNTEAQTRPAQYALEFTNDHQAVRIEPNALLDFTGDFTVEAWVKPYEDARNKTYKFVLSKNYAGTGFALVMVGRDNEQRFQFEANDIAAYGLYQGYNERAFRNQWIHLAAEVKGKQMFLFMNGIWVGSADIKKYPPANPLPFYIGSSPWGSFRGCIDEVRIWKGARSHIDIVQNMHRRISPSADGLLADYRFDEGAGTLAHANSAFGLDGKLIDRIPKSEAVPDPLPHFVPGVDLQPSWAETALSCPVARVTVNGKPLPYIAGYARMIDGTVCVPVKALAPAIDATWKCGELPSSDASHVLTMSRGKQTLQLPLDSFDARLNGKPLDIPVPAFKVTASSGGDMVYTEFYAPLRQTVESLGGSVRWNSLTKSAEITI